jgi:hypothetical protein
MVTADDSSIYRDLIRFKPDGLSANAWALKAGVSRTVWADMKRHGNPSRRTLEKLLAAAGSSLAEFEALRIGPEATHRDPMVGGVSDASSRRWGPAPLDPLPLLACVLDGEWGGEGSGIELIEIRPDELIDRVQRPQSLAADREAYALTIVGDSMWPRFRPGRRVAVSPRSPVAIGDDVVVRLNRDVAGGEVALLKELVKRTGTHIELRQFNPDKIFAVATKDVKAIHKVAGELF